MEFDDEDAIEAKLEASEKRWRLWLLQQLDNLADASVAIIRGSVPVFSSYTLRHVDRSAVMWRPGGAGGGGHYEAVAGIKRGDSKHPLYAEFGTGLYGMLGWYIVPNVAPYMVFRSSYTGRLIRKKSVRGQQPQRYFYQSWRSLLMYAEGRTLATRLPL
jgi:hypothetical protein